VRDDYSRPNFATAPREYDQRYMNVLVRQMNDAFAQILSTGPIQAQTINISSLPTSASGLRSGDLWNDSGTVKIV